MQIARYGLDAPGLARGFWLGGLAASILAVATSGMGPAVAGRWVAGLLVVVAVYLIGMGSLMVWDSLVEKPRAAERMLDLHRWTGRESVLDVGCGRGMLLVAAARRLSVGRVTGIDVWRPEDQSGNRPEAAVANARNAGVDDRVTVLTADMRALPFPDAGFDAIVSGWAVHNLDAVADRGKALDEMVRVLRPGGIILLSDIACHTEYIDRLRALKLSPVDLWTDRPLRRTIVGAVSLGSYRPAAVIARKPA